MLLALQLAAQPLTQRQCCMMWTGRFVVYFLGRIEVLRSHGVEPYVAFDGARLPIKAEEETTRRRCMPCLGHWHSIARVEYGHATV